MTKRSDALIRQTISVPGMHCRSCEISLSDELQKVPGVTAVKASAARKVVELAVAANSVPSDIAIAQAVKRAGYDVGGERLPVVSKRAADYRNVLVGVIVAVGVLVVLRQLGLDTTLGDSETQDGVWMPLLIGGLAGVSTCMALVGGLVAGLGAKYASQHPGATTVQKFAPHMLFNAGRIVGFMVLGGVLGWIGSALSLSPVVLGVLTIGAALLMLLVGLQLTGMFPRLTALTLPPSVVRKLGFDRVRQKGYSHGGAALLGVLSFFLPCGFTQAMQLAAAASGSWVDGALIMGLFAIGTTPGLLLIGGATALIRGRRSSAMLGVVGAVIIVLALSNAVAGARIMGFDMTIATRPAHSERVASDESVIRVDYRGGYDFDVSEVRIKTGQQYRLQIYSQKTEYGCMSTAMLPPLSTERPQLLRAGRTIMIPIRADSPGEYPLICAMGVPFNLTIIAEA